MDVLRLLPTELTGPEIADQLVISLNTLRTHTKNIYSKFGVSNRRRDPAGGRIEVAVGCVVRVPVEEISVF
ncbi:MAG: helix-turn-helix transcriptional regulator [Caldilineaceae bacterium]